MTAQQKRKAVESKAVESNWTGIERRRSSRFGLALPIQIVRLRGIQVDLTGQTTDLSSNGAMFFVSQGLAPGTSIEFVVTLQDGLSSGEKVCLRCQGHVVRTKPTGQNGRRAVATTIDRYQFAREAAH